MYETIRKFLIFLAIAFCCFAVLAIPVALLAMLFPGTADAIWAGYFGASVSGTVVNAIIGTLMFD